MNMMNKAKYLSLLVLLGVWGCTSNQYVSKSGGGYDDLYGSGSNSGIVSRDRNIDEDIARSDNPDYYRSTQTDPQEGTSDYYDDSYLSSRGVPRALSGNEVGYNAGFVDGYNQASRNNYPFNGLGSYWPGSGFSMNIGFGMGSMFRMSPYLGFGMGSMMGYGYSPFGYNRMMGYSPFGYSPFGYDPFGYGGWGYSPYSSMYGMGYGMYDSFYGGFGGYGYGYNPWAYNRPVIVVNNMNDRNGVSRTYGPRGASSRSSDRYNSGFVNNSRSASGSNVDRSARRSADAGGTYSAPRSASRSAERGVSTGRTGVESNGRTYSRGTSEGGNVYYSRPRSTGDGYSSGRYNTDGYSSPRATRSSAPSYSAPTRSQSNYSTPSRTYNAPTRESYNTPSRTYNSPSRESYSAPSRTYNAPTPSYSAPSRSYSAPSGGGGGGGASRSSSRGPR